MCREYRKENNSISEKTGCTRKYFGRNLFVQREQTSFLIVIYNTCSFATCSPDGICPNAACCREKGLDGCYECEELPDCGKGFYANGNDGNAVKALGLFIRKYGKKELGSVMDRLHQKYDFRKIQEIIGYDIYEGLKILEENRQ